MQIEVIRVEVDIPSGKKYKVATISYKMGSKDYSKKVMSFGDGKPVYDVLTTNPIPGRFDISIDEASQYKNWIKATPVSATTPATSSLSPANTSPKSNYETSEERAQRQVYIIRQSSLERAISVSSSSDISKILVDADVFVEYVTKGLEPALQKLAEQGMTRDDLVFQKIKELENDIPY